MDLRASSPRRNTRRRASAAPFKLHTKAAGPDAPETRLPCQPSIMLKLVVTECLNVLVMSGKDLEGPK